jgi:S-adenosylmethionine/arginine decarboxylase-like enzyme
VEGILKDQKLILLKTYLRKEIMQLEYRHAAIHTWVNEKFFSFDAYSCKDFDSQKVVDSMLEQI